MKRLAFPVVVMLILAAAAPFVVATAMTSTVALAKTKTKPRAQQLDPESVVRAIYQQYSKEAGPAEAQQQYFTESLYALWIDVQQSTTTVDDVGVDFDVFLYARDLDAVSDLTTTFTADGTDKGIVEAKFTAGSKPKTVEYAMAKTTKGWRIDDISWGPQHGDLRGFLTKIKEAHAD